MKRVWNVWNGAATLGEGPVWDARQNKLWFVDIKQHKVHCFDPCAKATRTWDAPGQVGWVLPAIDGTLIAGLQQGLSLFNPADGSFNLFAEVEPDLPGNRLNDATVGADGSIWFGSMDDGEKSQSGRFYRWDGKSVRAVDLKPVCITNGPALSPDGSKLYHVDTVGGVINVATLDESGTVNATREFVRIAPEDGHPDGCIVDSRGNIWVGLWGGWRARLYSPGGEILHEVELPASNVTKIALGGKDLTTAYATTARAGLSENELESQPEAGSVFAFKVDIPGLWTPTAAIPVFAR